jgi:hypothetical protein
MRADAHDARVEHLESEARSEVLARPKAPAPREHPILFSGPMVRAILDGRKTQTRRVVKPQPAPNSPHDGGTTWVYRPEDGLHIPCGTVGHLTVAEKTGLRCPYGQPWDRLWVRETWSPDHRDVYPCYDFVYRADGTVSDRDCTEHIQGCTEKTRGAGVRHFECLACTSFRWRPSIHMPRKACRLRLEVVSVRIERLQVITEDDALAEGALAERQRAEAEGRTTTADIPSALRAFKRLWESINGTESWAANPWVWVVEFRREVVARG